MSTLLTTPSGGHVTETIIEKFHILCLRLLKGAPPGQEAVNHYISELSIVKGGNHKLDTKYRKHLAMIEVKTDCLASYFHFLPFSRLVKMSTTTTTSFLGKVQWTGERY